MSAGAQVIQAGQPMSAAQRDQVLRLGMGIFLGTVTMLFGAFSSAYIVRGATSQDWQAVALPGFLWWNTLAIVASSATLIVAGRCGRRGNWQATFAWLLGTLFLALLFLGGQYAAWQWLWAQDVGVPTTPHSSFFFILTGVHAVHLIAGLVVLAVTTLRVPAVRSGERPARHALLPLALGAMLWHFLAGLWVYLLIMLTSFA